MVFGIIPQNEGKMKELVLNICVIACKSLYLQAIIFFVVIELIL